MAITLRLTEEQQAQLDNLKRFLSMKSSSKALLHAAGEHRKLKDELERERPKKPEFRVGV